jgi:hypothetical protein
MTNVGLKAIFAFDQASNTFTPSGHNLTPDKAEEKARTIEGQGLKVKALDQPIRHKCRSFKTCASCNTAAENLSGQESQDPELDQESEVE